jgi:hypothetical protein
MVVYYIIVFNVSDTMLSVFPMASTLSIRLDQRSNRIIRIGYTYGIWLLSGIILSRFPSNILDLFGLTTYEIRAETAELMHLCNTIITTHSA